jgi:hypothetical protein
MISKSELEEFEHEVNNKITVVSGNIDLIRLGKSKKERLKFAERAWEGMNELTEAIQRFIKTLKE